MLRDATRWFGFHTLCVVLVPFKPLSSACERDSWDRDKCVGVLYGQVWNDLFQLSEHRLWLEEHDGLFMILFFTDRGFSWATSIKKIQTDADDGIFWVNMCEVLLV